MAAGTLIQAPRGDSIRVVAGATGTTKSLGPPALKEVVVTRLLIWKALLKFIQGERLLVHLKSPNSLLFFWLVYESGCQMFAKTELTL